MNKVRHIAILFIFLGFSVGDLWAQEKIKELRKIDRAVIQGNLIFITTEQSSLPFHELINIDLANKSQSKMYKTNIHRVSQYNISGQPMLCRIVGKYLYGVSANNELGPDQWSFGLNKTALSLFQPQSDGTFADIRDITEGTRISQDRGGYLLDPIIDEMSHQFANI